MSDWEIRFSNSRSRPYFFNSSTQESKWEPPAELSEDEINALPGAEHLTYSGNAQPAPATDNANGKVRASHLLVKHSGSRRPSSWKEANITRSKADAIDILKRHQQTLAQSPDLAAAFASLARTESDCSSAREGGDLGFFGRKQMQKPFEDATFATEVGQLSDIVDTDSGVHIILRTA